MFRIVKKIDILLVRSFFPPFIVALFIAMFVLIMQFLWSFIDEIIGKGLNTFDLVELLGYRSITLIPMALPIGVLLSSVMVFGNLSERYELSALKSAGVSLIRIMRPVIACSIAIATFSLVCSNWLIPWSMLKFQARLWDIRNQKPALSLEESIYNHDFKDFTIRIGKKHRDNRTIEDIQIYDQSTNSRRQFNVLAAKRGEMFISEDNQNFVMKLYDGYQYQESNESRPGEGYPFTQTSFKEWTKYFNLAEFELRQTDESYFKSHQMMKSMRQLVYEIDTIGKRYETTRIRSLYDFSDILHNRAEAMERSGEVSSTSDVGNTGQAATSENPSEGSQVDDDSPITEDESPEPSSQPDESTGRIAKVKERYKPPLEQVLDTMPADASWSAIFSAFPERSQKKFVTSAKSRAKALGDNSRRLKVSLEMIESNRIGHIYELHMKMSFAAICIIFLFIGAPMGAIVRKGGYGYPLLVAIIFFTAYIILNVMFDKLSETRVLHPVVGAWAPCLIMAPISAFLTIKAMNDTKIVGTPAFLEPLVKWFKARRDEQRNGREAV